ncbi:uncharacterized protein LOC120505113 [Passer montanus]|uniref:uncharacterized protein LOC120505113 n=1 Tax=Passer montanus TaxID=9160 RepID=UPI0019602075|nr:uncharacterized protein LOC120505113 [Passer montanus]
MEPLKLSPALLEPQVTVGATLGELLAIMARWDEEMIQPMSAVRLNSDLEDLTREVRATIKCIDDTWWPDIVTSDGDDPVTPLSQALAAYKSTPGTTWDHVKMVAREWQGSVDVLGERWVKLARAATEIRNAWSEVATKEADRVITVNSLSSYLQDEAACEWTAQENMVELGLALGREEGAEVGARHEAWVWRDARVAASEVTRAIKDRQWVEVTLGLLERLVAAGNAATTFPWELQRLLRDIKAAMKGKNEASRDVPEDLVAKVAVAERLWEANALLAKDHLLGTLQDIIKFDFDDEPASPSACGVAERCQRAIEDIPRFLRLPECPQHLPPPQLEMVMDVVAIVGEVVATVTGPYRGKCLCKAPNSLHEVTATNEVLVATVAMGEAVVVRGAQPGSCFTEV